jgi:putative transposase
MSRVFRDMGITDSCTVRCSEITDFSATLGLPSPPMPSGLGRCYGRGHLHFITASCYRREPLLGTARGRDLFVKVLEQVRQKYRLVVVGYVVMPEHFHLLIREPERANPSVVIQALKLGVARRILASRQRQQRRQRNQPWLWQDTVSNRMWQARFYDFNVWSGRKRVEKVRYIHRNPVRRGLVERPEQWRWSSFRAYAFGEAGGVRVNDWTLLTAARKPDE